MKNKNNYYKDTAETLRWMLRGGGQHEADSRRFKSGPASLHWRWQPGSVLIARGFSVRPDSAPRAGMEGWIYSGINREGALEFRLGTAVEFANGRAHYRFRFRLGLPVGGCFALCRTDTPILAMIRELEEGRILLSVADPDLRLPKRRNMAYLDDEALRTQARASSVRVELRGAWRAVHDTACRPSEDIGCSKNKGAPDALVEVSGDRSNQRTHLVLVCRYGETREIELAPCAHPQQTKGIRIGSCETNRLRLSS